MKCIVCGKELTSRRKDARFCSAGCRVKGGRIKESNVTGSVTGNVTTVTHKPASVTDTARIDSLNRPCVYDEEGKYWVDPQGSRMCKTPGCTFIAAIYNSEYCWKCEPPVFHSPRPLTNKPIADQQKKVA